MSAHPQQALRAQDYGFFGPDSPSWKVWSSPTSLIGFQRAVVLEHFDPFLAAAVADMRGIYTNPGRRLDRTLAYFLTVAVADGRTATEASRLLMRVHAKVQGIEPISGTPYSANSPESQLWIHVTGWHSVLKCYELYGPGPLSEREERRYWEECAVAAELQTCKPADVPRSRDEVRAYFEAVRPRLCTSERAHEGMHYLLRTPRANAGWAFWGISRILAPATVASLPRWMRVIGGFDQGMLADGITPPLARIAMQFGQWPVLKVAALRYSAPNTARIMRAHHAGGVPANARTVTPAECRARTPGLHVEDVPSRVATPEAATAH
ncbi:MAG: oxygenase MpaB family protein [Algiphilus sp.]|uniref:oxygenase MpaB family protein n=1 Tax=Algiphilus sp. TaxID=1872431 RepID=UPI0032EFBF3B